jgi:[acyl-carrier-protein] S-malonyltransferase
MGKEFYQQYPSVREAFEEAGDILKKDFAKMCFDASQKKELDLLENSQCALLTVSYATYRIYEQEIGIKPDYCVGHSLGEYSALCCAGAIRFGDALQLVRDRGLIIKEVSAALDGTMMWVINLDRAVVEDTCREMQQKEEKVYISAYDSPTQVSISGIRDSVIKAAKDLENKGAIVYPLKMSGPFHSPLMSEAAARMEAVLKQFRYTQPRYPVIANRNARLYEGPETVVENLSQQLVSPIRWQDSILYLAEQGVATAVEIGPKDVLKFLVQKNSDALRTFTLDNNDDLARLKKGLLLEEDEFIPLIGKCLGVAVGTRNRNFDPEEYRERVIKPYRQLEALYEKLLSNGKQAAGSQVKDAVQTLQAILDGKKIPVPEHQREITRLFAGKRLKSI